MEDRVIFEEIDRGAFVPIKGYDKYVDVGDYVADVLNLHPVRITLEDFGIGSYEYWGATGTDVNWQPVADEEDLYLIIEVPTGELTEETIEALGDDKMRFSYTQETDDDQELLVNLVWSLDTILTYKGKTFICMEAEEV